MFTDSVLISLSDAKRMQRLFNFLDFSSNSDDRLNSPEVIARSIEDIQVCFFW